MITIYDNQDGRTMYQHHIGYILFGNVTDFLFIIIDPFNCAFPLILTY